MRVRDEAAAMARCIFELRQQRARHLPADALSDVCWMMLLAFFVADADGRRITAIEAIEAAEVPISVGQRWLAVLNTEKLVVGDGDGHVEDIVTLTGKGVSAIEACMADAQQLLRTIDREMRAA